MPTENATDTEITEALQKLVTDEITAGTFVIPDADPSRNYYLQFALDDGDRLYCEAVSKQYQPSPSWTDQSGTI